MTEFLVFVGLLALIGLVAFIVFWVVWFVSEVFALRRDVDRHYKYLTDYESQAHERYWELRNKKADKPDPTKPA